MGKRAWQAHTYSLIQENLWTFDWTYYFDKPPFQIISLEVFVHRIFFNTTALNIKACFQLLSPSSLTQIKQHLWCTYASTMCACAKHLCFSTSVIFVRCNANTFENYDVPHFCKGYRKKSNNLFIRIIFAQKKLTKNVNYVNVNVKFIHWNHNKMQKCVRVQRLPKENVSYNEYMRQKSFLLFHCECVKCTLQIMAYLT